MNVVETEVRKEAHVWRARIDAGLSAAERAEFDQWMMSDPHHGEAFAEAEILWKGLAHIDYPSVEPSNDDLIDTEAQSYSGMAQIHYLKAAAPRITAAFVSMAAVIVFMVLIGLPLDLWQPEASEPKRFVTSADGSKAISLTDDSRITLKPDAEILVDYRDDIRLVSLIRGSASFRVESNKAQPFVIDTDYADVRVTGTRFETILRDDGIEVAVIEGSVDLLADFDAANQPPAARLAAGDAVFTKDGIEIRKANSRFASARNTQDTRTVQSPAGTDLGVQETAQLKYVRAPLSQVAGDISRLSGQEIVVDASVADMRFSGTFDAQDPEAILATIVDALPVDLIEKDGVQTIIASS